MYQINNQIILKYLADFNYLALIKNRVKILWNAKRRSKEGLFIFLVPS
jgi:hypothetical protein